MDAASVATGVSWTSALSWFAGAYAIGVAVFLLLENRSPQSTFSWLFLLLVFPLGGLVIYVLFGRGRHAFSRERSLTRLIEGGPLAGRAGLVVAQQPAKLARLAREHGEYARLATMLWATARSPLTFGNQLEVLQDAREKYPRLMADMRDASRSIHLLYYEWASDPFTRQVARVLADTVSQGVQVRIIYDPVGSFWGLSHRDVRDLRHPQLLNQLRNQPRHL
jgi:cardiolipin synthase A/B